VQARVTDVTESLDFVLQMQFSAFQFHDFEVIDRGVGQAIRDFDFEGLVAFHKFREVRLHRHAECLLNPIVPDTG
jgi:hypothetical protein